MTDLSLFDNKTVLITGATGSFGKGFTKHLLDNTNAKKIIVFSRDEYKQHLMAQEFNDPRLRFFLGDVRDLQRLERAFHGVDIVVHAAALKQIPALEYNPFEAVKTNIIGSQNVIEAGVNQNVSKVLLVSTDKAAQPVNLYGATKLTAERLFVAGNSYGAKATRFSVVRYGNVLGSRGSLVEIILNRQIDEKVKVTDIDMTRFWITLKESYDLVVFALQNMEGGEIFIPKVPSMKIVDLVEALAPGVEREIIGIRPGEKVHEVLLTEDESRHSFDLGKYYIVLPSYQFAEGLYAKYKNFDRLRSRFRYSSDSNTEWLSIDDVKKIVSR